MEVYDVNNSVKKKKNLPNQRLRRQSSGRPKLAHKLLQSLSKDIGALFTRDRSSTAENLATANNKGTGYDTSSSRRKDIIKESRSVAQTL